jgi:hypothetical protein
LLACVLIRASFEKINSSLPLIPLASATFCYLIIHKHSVQC